jgi:hypothetical protein
MKCGGWKDDPYFWIAIFIAIGAGVYASTA